MNFCISAQVSPRKASKLESDYNGYAEFQIKYGRLVMMSRSDDRRTRRAVNHLRWIYTNKEFLARHNLSDFADIDCIVVLLTNPKLARIAEVWTVIYDDVYLSPCDEPHVHVSKNLYYGGSK